MKLFIISLLIITSQLTFADDVITKAGKHYKNVKITSDVYSHVDFLFNGTEKRFSKENLKSWSKDVPFNPDQISEMVDDDFTMKKDSVKTALADLDKKESLTKEDLYRYMKLQEKSELLNKPVTFKYTEYRNLKYLGIAIPAFVGAGYFFTRYSFYSDTRIDNEDYLKALEKDKFMNQILIAQLKDINNKYDSRESNNLLAGIGFACIGVISATIALIPAEIEVGPNMIALTYKF